MQSWHLRLPALLACTALQTLAAVPPHPCIHSQLTAEAKRLGLRPCKGGRWGSDEELRGAVLAALLLEGA